jgi:hypothetical protein
MTLSTPAIGMIIALAACLVLPVSAWSRDDAGQKADAEQSGIRAFCKQHHNGKVLSRTELFFGLSKPGGIVSEADFQRFMETEVTPRFPAGLTVLNANGQFKDATGTIIQEDSKLVILHFPATKANHDAVERIRNAYKAAFQQESVLRVDRQTCVSY